VTIGPISTGFAAVAQALKRRFARRVASPAIRFIEPFGSMKEKAMRTITPPEHREGPVATAIEQQTAKLPSDTFLWLAGASIATSLTFRLLGRDRDAMFVGQWAPTFLVLGLYNKLVKLLGTD
jgi:hypothetical protein